MTQQPDEVTEIYRPTTKDNSAIADAFEKVLKDPDSARFPVIYARKAQSGLIYYCGFVNSRNSYGGYVGNQPFFAMGDDRFVSVQKIGGTEIEKIVVTEMCRRKGFPPLDG
ncbi:hypothetical protein [Aureimonas ureilytica]|uniref:hypothetical protein n=1 Tax=Aureimonas ureilytica TaxID=401562 RepID=UPI00128F5E50|nr:hypothetical protein [Aureimonas ureilytica]